MAATTYCINTTLAGSGDTHQVDYWPDGDGQEWPGYVTSLPQYCADLRENLSSSKLSLYVVTTTGYAKLISDDDELRSAVDALPDRGVLSVTAVMRLNNKNKRRSAEEWLGAEDELPKWYDEEDSEVTSDLSDDDDGDENVESFHVKSNEAKIHPILERFSVYAEGNCYHCGTAEWKGVRYCCAWDTDYSLCTKCYKNLPKAQKDDWESAATTWETDAPEYPLYREEEPTVRSEVCHLQYILTRLGFMPLSATEQLVGSYQSNTEKAVRRFRERYGIRGGNMGVYNEKTAKKLAQVVRQFREAEYKYI